MSNTSVMFERFEASRRKLTDVLNTCEPAVQQLGAQGALVLLQTIRQRIDSERLKVLILGQFKQGKSTLINALLGAEVLPAFAVPCTAVINEIKYGDVTKARVHFRDPLPASLPESLAAGARAHIAAHGGKDVPPLDIAVEDIERFVVIPDPGKDHGESVAESPFRLVEIFWPIKMCRNGVEIIDSPGLNEHGTRTRVTVDYLGNVDAVVFVLSCIALAGESEMTFIENNLRLAGHEEIFFCCNRFDQVREKERQRVVDFGREKLGALTAMGRDGIFFVSALDALEGRLENSPEKAERSGFLPFENRLSHFLAESRGRLKLLQPARQISVEFNKLLSEEIPHQQRLLRTNAEELQKRWQDVQPALQQAEMRCRLVAERMERDRDLIRLDVEEKLEQFLAECADQVPAWLEKFKPKTEIKVLSLDGFINQAKPLVQECSAHVEQELVKAVAEWRKTILVPRMKARLESMGADIQESVAAIAASVARVKRELDGGNEPAESNPDLSSGAARSLADAIALGASANEQVSGAIGIVELLATMSISIGVGVALIVLGFANPFVLVALLSAGASVYTGNMVEKIKKKCGDLMSKRIKEAAHSEAKRGADGIYKKTLEIQQQIELALKREVQGVYDTANAVMREKKAGEEAVSKRLAELDAVAVSLRSAQASLQDVVFDLAH